MAVPERFIQYVDIREALKPVSIYDGAGAPVPATWMAVSVHVPSSRGPGGYSLYLLDGRGCVLDLYPYETLEILLDQAKVMLGVAAGEWCACEVAVPDDWDVLDRRMFGVRCAIPPTLSTRT